VIDANSSATCNCFVDESLDGSWNILSDISHQPCNSDLPDNVVSIFSQHRNVGGADLINVAVALDIFIPLAHRLVNELAGKFSREWTLSMEK
jgi:hypothetical protein